MTMNLGTHGTGHKRPKGNSAIMGSRQECSGCNAPLDETNRARETAHCVWCDTEKARRIIKARRHNAPRELISFL